MIEKYISKNYFKKGTRIKDDLGNMFEVVAVQPMFLLDSTRRDFGLTVINLEKEFKQVFGEGLERELNESRG